MQTPHYFSFQPLNSLSASTTSNVSIWVLSSSLLLGSIIYNATNDGFPFKTPGNHGISLPCGQLYRVNRLAWLHRTRLALQRHSNPIHLAPPGKECIASLKMRYLDQSKLAKGYVWCWKYYLWKKHYPKRKQKAPRYWKEYKCFDSLKIDFFFFFPQWWLHCFLKPILA